MELGYNSKIVTMELVNVVSQKPINNIIKVAPHENVSSEFMYDAVVLNKIPNYGDMGVVLKCGGNENQAYWIGKIEDAVKNVRMPSTAQKPGEAFIASDDGQSAIKLNKDNINIINKNTSIQSDTNKLTIQQGFGTIDLSSKKFQLTTSKSTFSITDNATNLSSPGSIYLSAITSLFLGTKGNVFICSGVANTKEKDYYSQLGSIQKFMLKTQEAKFAIGSQCIFDAGGMNINVASGKIAGGEMPGKGSKMSFKLNVVQGDMALSAGTGNILISALSSPVGAYYIKLRAGNQPTDFAYSEIKLDRKKLTIEQDSGLNASIELSAGSATHKAKQEIKLNSQGTIKLISTRDTTIEADKSIEMTSKTKIKIDGKTEVSIATQILKLQDAQQIQAGNKSVQPTGMGPFCAIPQCIISGSNHTGPTAM